MDEVGFVLENYELNSRFYGFLVHNLSFTIHHYLVGSCNKSMNCMAVFSILKMTWSSLDTSTL
jgi:hypothetical protein